mmetsp:Transcript_2060/g.3965  ORF Transcript_2060/g.3965 Transcript_2060/m.3965 type:complete len:226 (+) Transcript_2060:439-1116(+)
MPTPRANSRDESWKCLSRKLPLVSSLRSATRAWIWASVEEKAWRAAMSDWRSAFEAPSAFSSSACSSAIVPVFPDLSLGAKAFKALISSPIVLVRRICHPRKPAYRVVAYRPSIMTGWTRAGNPPSRAPNSPPLARAAPGIAREAAAAPARAFEREGFFEACSAVGLAERALSRWLNHARLATSSSLWLNFWLLATMPGLSAAAVDRGTTPARLIPRERVDETEP